MHLFVSSFQGIRAVKQVLGYLLPRNMSSIKTKINFNTKHLTKGDPLPPYNGKLRLYNMRYCPFAQRAVLALNVKNIDYEVVNIDLVDKPEWLALKSPLTKVPALEISDGMSIYESLVIVEYLDDVYPQRRLLPEEPVTKAFDKILVEVCTPLIHSLYFKLVKTPESVSDDVVAGYFKALDLLQMQLLLRGTKFLDGPEPGYADYMIWPWFERLPIVNDKRKDMDETKYKVLIQALCYKLVKAPELVTDDDVAGYFKALDMLQMQLLLRGTKFFDGPEPGYADYMIWPWFERLPSVNDKRIDMDDAKYRVLLEYIANMWEDSGVKEYAVPKEIIQAFHKAYALGNKPDYDVLLEE